MVCFELLHAWGPPKRRFYSSWNSLYFAEIFSQRKLRIHAIRRGNGKHFTAKACSLHLLQMRGLTKVFEWNNYGGPFWTKMQSNRDLHSIGSYPCSIGSYLSSIRSYFHSIRSYFHSTGSYLSSIRSYFNYFVASYMTLVYSSVVFHIYPYLRGNSIPSDRNYRSAVVTIWSAVKRGRLNLDLVLVWRHTTYDYMTYN